MVVAERPLTCQIEMNYGNVDISFVVPHRAHESKLPQLQQALYSSLYQRFIGQRQTSARLDEMRSIVDSTAPLLYLLLQLGVRIA
jgi:hypothetical protein